MNHQTYRAENRTLDLVKSAIVIALYMALTFLVAPVAFGPVQFRISEILNYLGLYNRRYVYAVTLGVFLANFYQYGIVDMVVGSLTTLVSFYISIWIGNRLVELNRRVKFFKYDEMLLKYIVTAFVFAAGCIVIALMLYVIGAEAAFWPTYLSLFISELVVMLLGMPIMYLISKRIDFNE
ncbi:QueT transporter family protein [Aerococcaceae bacterium zg-BR9]|uniref:QueT transporter family protein n=1 Tax=Aerococcaceae bacterium zg-1292 TaxID=2774330 RepID=UPI00406470FE|nr:QueT transporter family protein [Aerococcaceae bacterium zg-BR9]MBF6978611.1 QueT transporter family protein [Aerococcaceae bacterium zg-BR22]